MALLWNLHIVNKLLPILQAININNNENALRKLNSAHDAVINNVLLRVRRKLK